MPCLALPYLAMPSLGHALPRLALASTQEVFLVASQVDV